MTTHDFFRVNKPQVISQTIDGEVVVINLQSGAYYSLTGAAAAIWDALDRGAAATEITDTLTAHFSDCDPGLEVIVKGFLNELRGEALIVASEKPGIPVMNGKPVQREKFVRPALKKFTDMQELLLLDPIHEVDPAGWPLAKPDPDHDPGK